MENILIECSERDGYSTSASPGDFNSTFKEPYFVYEGDEVAISKCFIDNKTESDGIINIANDLQINGFVSLYTTNIDVTKVADFRSSPKVNDNSDYFASSLVTQGKLVEKNMIHLTKVLVYRARDKFAFGDKSGDNPLTCTYLDVLGVRKSFFLNVPYIDDGSERFPVQFTSLSTNVFMQKGSMQVNDHNGNYAKNNVEPVADNTEPPAGGPEGFSGVKVQDFDDTPTFQKELITPINNEFQFTVPGGDYLPQDLATLINDKLTINNAAVTFDPGEQLVSPFMKTFAQQSEGFTTPLLISKQGTPGNNSIVLKSNYWIGSNLIELQFDTADQKFYWNFLHQPIYGASQFCTAIVEREIEGGFINQTKNGGCVFFKFDAIETFTDNEGIVRQRDFDFLEGILKFKASKFLATEHFEPLFTEDGTADVYHASRVTSFDGINTTNAKNTIDGVIEKAKGSLAKDTQWQQAKTSDFDPIESSLNTVVKADSSAVSGSLLSSAFYFVKLSGCFTNTLVSSDKITRDINAIVSRYYSLGSYTSTSLDPSMIYTHRGEPILLTEANITILNPDRSIANVGNDNTIFIEIVRGPYYKQLMADTFNSVQIEAQQEAQQQAQLQQKK